MLQLELFEKAYTDQYQEHGLLYEMPQVGDVTFLNGMNEPVHRWFRLTPSYAPELVRHLVEALECDSKTFICEPFLGKGTTIIELKKLGLHGIGIELNPLLKLASEYALTWEVNVNSFAQFVAETNQTLSTLLRQCQAMSLEQALSEYDLALPTIHDVFRWWKPDVLKDLLLIKNVSGQIENQKYKKLYWLALCSAALDCANVHRNHPTISFDDDHTRQIDVLAEFSGKLAQIVQDLQTLPARSTWGEVSCVNGDSTRLAEFVDEKIDRVITSPPYPNRFSYVHTTRPQLFFMDVIQEASKSAEIDLAAIGGTWGKATSVLYDGIIEPHANIANALDAVIQELRPKSNLMCNYAIKYFNMMDDHIRELKTRASRKFRGAYVVGNSRLSGVEILTEVILAKSFESNGFKVDKILVLRKRGGKKKLFETVICVSANHRFS